MDNSRCVPIRRNNSGRRLLVAHLEPHVSSGNAMAANRLHKDDDVATKLAKLKAGQPSDRCRKTTALAVAGGRLLVRTARKTFEFELGCPAGNLPTIIAAVKEAGLSRIASDLEASANKATDTA
jgi:hypothetical protein